MTHAIIPSHTIGFAACTPGGQLLGHTFRETEAEAIKAAYENPEHWANAQRDGWTVQEVHAHLTPLSRSV